MKFLSTEVPENEKDEAPKRDTGSQSKTKVIVMAESEDMAEFTPEDDLTISVTVSNTGSRDGMEPVILYSSDLVASISPDVLRVKGFEKGDQKAGESKCVSFIIPASALAFVNYQGKWTLEKGDFAFTIANQKAQARCTSTIVYPTPNI